MDCNKCLHLQINVHTFENRQCINLASMLIDILPQYSKNNTNCVCQGLDLCVVGENQIYVAHATLVSFDILNLDPTCVTVRTHTLHIPARCYVIYPIIYERLSCTKCTQVKVKIIRQDVTVLLSDCLYLSNLNLRNETLQKHSKHRLCRPHHK